MKPLIFVPPAQAEALSDTQDDLRSRDIGPRQPWRDEDGADEPLPYERLPRQRPERAVSNSAVPNSAVSNAQLWPSSVNSSR